MLGKLAVAATAALRAAVAAIPPPRATAAAAVAGAVMACPTVAIPSWLARANRTALSVALRTTATTERAVLAAAPLAFTKVWRDGEQRKE